MTSLLTRIGLAAIVALSGISATASTAAASDRGFGIHGNGIYVQYYDRHPDRDRDWRRHHRRPGCSPARTPRKPPLPTTTTGTTTERVRRSTSAKPSPGWTTSWG